MDELVRVFHGGMVKENGEFENMVEDIELFDSPPLLKDLVNRVFQNIHVELMKYLWGVDLIVVKLEHIMFWWHWNLRCIRESTRI